MSFSDFVPGIPKFTGAGSLKPDPIKWVHTDSLSHHFWENSAVLWAVFLTAVCIAIVGLFYTWFYFKQILDDLRAEKERKVKESIERHPSNFGRTLRK